MAVFLDIRDEAIVVRTRRALEHVSHQAECPELLAPLRAQRALGMRLPLPGDPHTERDAASRPGRVRHVTMAVLIDVRDEAPEPLLEVVNSVVEKVGAHQLGGHLFREVADDGGLGALVMSEASSSSSGG